MNVVTQSETRIFSPCNLCKWHATENALVTECENIQWNHQTATDYSQFQGGLCPFSSVTEPLGRIISACQSIQTHRCVVHVKMRDDGCAPTQEC